MCHVTKSEYESFRITNFTLLTALLLNTLIGKNTGNCPINEGKLVLIIATLSFICINF
jgi:hypothetical protein